MQNHLQPVCIKRIVAMGDSITWGYSASKKEKCWVNITASLLEEYTNSNIVVINQGVGANVLTPECPSYGFSSKPSAIERVEDELVKYEPDLVFLAYGLNDSRGGTNPEVFRFEYQKLVDMILDKIKPKIVLVNIYYMHEMIYKNCLHWESSDYHVTQVFNLIIEQLAEKNGLIYADIYESMAGADWLIDSDHCHPNDLGHRIIANKVFEAIAKNLDFYSGVIKQESPSYFEKYGNGPDRRSY